MDTLKRKAESGFTITVQAVYYTTLLFIFFALIFDFGNAGYMYTMCSNATRMAALDASKNIDEEVFLNDQEIRLSDDAMERAQELVSAMTEGRATITDLAIADMTTPDGIKRSVIVVRARVVVPLPIMSSLFGLNSITIPVDGYAEPAYGISAEGQ